LATTLREIGFKLGYDVDKASEKKAEDSIKSLKDTATKLLGAIGIGFSLVKINGLIEEFGAVNNGIRSIVDSTEEAAEAQQTVLKAANDCRMSYADMATTVSNLSKATGDIFNVDDAANYAAAVTKVMKTAGRSDSTITGVIEGMNKSFQKGVMDTETLNKMLEDAPETADVLAKHLGVAKSQLLDMASKGTIKVNDLKDAFLNSAEEIDAAYANVNLTVTDAIKNIRNTWGLWLADMDKTFGVTNSIARAMVKLSDTAMTFAQRIKTRLEWLADKLGGTDKLLKLIAITVGAVFLALNAGKIVSFLKDVRSLLTAHNAKILAIIAAIVLLALLVEDFFAFMKGENSLIGEILERNGVDVEAFRQDCKDLWEQVKDIIDVFKQFARTIGNQLLSALKQVLPLLGKLVAAILPVILELIEAIVPILVQIVETILPVVLELISALLPIIEPIMTIVANLVQSLLPVLVSLLNAILPILEPILAILQPIADILGVIINAIAKVVGWVADGLGWIVDKIFGGGGDTSAAEKVNAYAGGTDNSSETFIAGEEGPELVTGARGRKVFTALETGKIFRAMAMLGKAATAKPSTITNSTSSRTINQYNEFTNTFNGDRAGQAKSEAAMSSASDNAVDAMARALAFAR
jgi:tape measure domain-containing protein